MRYSSSTSDLHQAALSGDKSRVRGLLLHHGVPLVDVETKHLCLYLAVSSGDRALAIRVLETGCDAISGLNQQGDTALHIACKSPIPDLLLLRRLVQEVGSAINVPNNYGETVLHTAASKGHIEAAAMFLASKTYVNAQNCYGDTPLHNAVRAEHIRMVCLLLVHGAKTSCENHKRELPILLAAKQHQDYILRVLLNQDVQPDLRVHKALTKCLRNAVLKGDSGLACLLLKKGAYVNGLVKGKENLLHLAASRGNSALIQVLVSEGADVNALSDDVTALHCASQRGHSEVVDILLANGAEVNTTTNDSSLALTAIHLATAGRHRLVLEKLCHYGADVNLCDSGGNTPLHTAAAMSSSCGSDCDIYNDPPDNILEVLLGAGADPTIRNHKGDMALHLAAHGGHTKQLHQLMAVSGTALEAEDGYGETLLPVLLALRRTDLVLLLLAHGAKASVLCKNHIRDMFLDTLDKAILAYDAVLKSGNLSFEDQRQYRIYVCGILGQRKSAFRAALASIGNQQMTLKSIVRSQLRYYLLYDCRVTKLWQAICSLAIPSLLQRYLLLQGHLELLKQFT